MGDSQKNIPAISVLMSVYNDERFLRESISSILNQDCSDFEFLIFDDASSDRSWDILQEFVRKDDRIRLFHNEKNIGLTATLNRGLEKAMGKYIARMDADDISLPNRFSLQYQFLEEHPEIFLCSGATEMIDESGNSLRILEPILEESALQKRLEKKCCLQHPSIFFRKSDIRYREKFLYAQDYDLYTRILTSGKRISCLSDLLLKYRVRKTSLSFSRMAHQKLFAQKATEFFRMRREKNTDEYDAFNPHDILALDPTSSLDPVVMMTNMKAFFAISDFRSLRKECLRFFRAHGFKLLPVLFFLLSFLGARFSRLLLKYLPIAFLRKWNE